METVVESKYNVSFYDKLKADGLIIFEVIVGSQAYGTATPASDVDKKFVYILPEEDILGLNYVPQIEVNKDYVGYEIRRFLELIASNNPTILEMLHSPEDCILTLDPVFEYVIKNKEQFITTICADSFGGYARQQIKKAKGLDKKQNYEKERIVRKEPIDFCYIINGYESYPLKKFLEDKNLDQKFCGVTSVPHARDIYALFYDFSAHSIFSEKVSPKTRRFNKWFAKITSKFTGSSMGLGYKGIYKNGEGVSKPESNALRLSSIPKNETCLATFSYNKDGYTAHCDDYNEYQKWLGTRNVTRWVETQNHGQKIDGKNMMHCARLIRMAIEIAEGKGLIVRRPDAQELLSIRRGEVSLEELIHNADEQISRMDQLFANSSLPKSIDKDFVHELLVKIRKEFYGRSKR